MKILSPASYQFIFLVLLTGWMFSSQANSNESVTVIDGWVRLTPPVAKNSAAYFTLHNTSNKDVTVLDVTTDIAKIATMHDVVMEMSMVRMVELKELKIPAAGKVVFAPGGKHLMLVNLTQKLKEHGMAKVTFTLDNGQVIITKMMIMKQPQHKHQH